jgi:hypothetical protein
MTMNELQQTLLNEFRLGKRSFEKTVLKANEYRITDREFSETLRKIHDLRRFRFGYALLVAGFWFGGLLFALSYATSVIGALFITLSMCIILIIILTIGILLMNHAFRIK